MAVDIIKKIGNVLSNFLLGETKETIIRTDEAVKRIDKDLDEVKQDIRSINQRIFIIEPKLEVLWKKALTNNHSPMTLNQEGQRVFEQSGIKDIVLENKEMLIKAIKNKNPQNPYQVQESAGKVMSLLKENPNILSRLEDGAFKAGVDVDSVLLTGSILLRDIALKELGFEIENSNNKRESK